MDLDTPLESVKGVGRQRAKTFASKGLLTAEDLLYYMPFRYEDRGNVKSIDALQAGETATVVGEIFGTQLFRPRHGALRMFEIRVRGDSGGILVGKWFRGDYLKSIFQRGQRVALYGKVEWNTFASEMSMVHPEYEILSDDDTEAHLHLGRIVPVYQAMGKVTPRVLRSLVHRCIEGVSELDDPLPVDIRRRLGLLDRRQALRETHFPPKGSDIRSLNGFRTAPQYRLIFEEFFYLECGLALKRRKARAVEGIAFSLNDRAREKIKQILPFKPTAAQKRVLKEIATDMSQPAPMNRLLQGDVGSGKTIVAVEAAVIAIENRYQVAIMAPTEVLAGQHYFNLKRLLEPVGYVVVLLTGSMTARGKTALKRLIAEGVAHVVVGTHAVISKDVEFQQLGLIVIDEQHRFGVIQRLRLLQKGKHPDVLVMTATPIPRTLALTLYGELDVSMIDELPPGRNPIITREAGQDGIEKVYSFVRRQVEAGRQVLCRLPRDRGVGDEGRQGRREDVRAFVAGRVPRPRCGPAARTLADREKRKGHGRLQQRRRFDPGVDDGDRSRRRRSQRDRHADRAGRKLRAVATSPASWTCGPRRGAKLLHPALRQAERDRGAADQDDGRDPGWFPHRRRRPSTTWAR